MCVGVWWLDCIGAVWANVVVTSYQYMCMGILRAPSPTKRRPNAEKLYAKGPLSPFGSNRGAEILKMRFMPRAASIEHHLIN